ncbi:DUF2971 domain-containing protein [Mucilaginibacter celer]|uniref:DUF2971 domain-containing protein n=1 Tax=Mucilaginibacter celer TaxID=2305508 RepID=A0A494VJU0_9SPHI|nr:DUF2971 domain-containing protein [Mucilaginibacter celer]AYL94584.1 DUF2971 domain-containing protein [Mucilaginibacter celer]
MDLEISKPEIISLRDFEMPPMVYKYRDWNNDSHKKIITQREVYFAAPNQFEDELDCKNPTRWDLLTEEDILNKFYRDSQYKNPQYTIEQHMEYAIYWSNNTQVRNKDFIAQMQQESFNQYCERTGVLSLTEYPCETRMWEKYSSMYTGFCIGFDTKLMLPQICNSGGKVIYHDELPIIHPFPKHSYINQALLQVFNKHNKWSFEKEYRAFKFRLNPFTKAERISVIHPDAVKEIILGFKISKENEDSLLSSIPSELNHVKIKKAFLQNDRVVVENYLKN